MRKLHYSLAAVLVLALACAAFAAAPLVQQLLPTNNDVKGFSVMPGSLQYGKGEGLTDIYDGGYQLYTRNGVIDAAQQMYKRGNDYVQVTVHTMKSDRAALDFLKYWQREHKAKSITRTSSSASFTVTKPNAMTYAQVRKYLVTISAFGSQSKAPKDTKAFLAAVEKKILARGK